MIELHFHCVFSLAERLFVVRMGKNVYRVLPDVLKAALVKADRQLADFDPNAEFVIDFGDQGGIRLNLSNKETCVCLKDYLQKVYDGWHQMTFANDGQNTTGIQ